MLTVLIPAYKNSLSLDNALRLLSKQTIARSINVIVSDDCPTHPLNLVKYYNEFKGKFGSLYLHRQFVNLGVVQNKRWLYLQVKTKYFTFHEHDDLVIDFAYYQKCLADLEANTSAAIFYGNTYLVNYEDMQSVCNSVLQSGGYNNDVFSSQYRSMYVLSQIVDASAVENNNYALVGGPSFIRAFILNHASTSFTAIVFRTSVVQEYGGYAGNYFLTKFEADILNYYDDEENLFILYLLALDHDFLINKFPSVVRNAFDPRSWSNSLENPAWKHFDQSLFLPLYKLVWAISYYQGSRSYKEITSIVLDYILAIGLAVNNLTTRKFLYRYQPVSPEMTALSSNLVSSWNIWIFCYRYLKYINRYLRNRFRILKMWINSVLSV